MNTNPELEKIVEELTCAVTPYRYPYVDVKNANRQLIIEACQKYAEQATQSVKREAGHYKSEYDLAVVSIGLKGEDIIPLSPVAELIKQRDQLRQENDELKQGSLDLRRQVASADAFSEQQEQQLQEARVLIMESNELTAVHIHDDLKLREHRRKLSQWLERNP